MTRKRTQRAHQRREHRRGRGRETGQETLQAILVAAFVLLPLVATIITFAGLVHVYIGAQAAAAIGARVAGTAGGFGPEQLARVDQELTANGIDVNSCLVVPSPSTVQLDEPISVEVTCRQSVGIPFLLQTDVTLSSKFVSRGEVNR